MCYRSCERRIGCGQNKCSQICTSTDACQQQIPTLWSRVVCGDAMVESKCLECGAHIGGGSHRVRNDNQHAPEIDNSHHPAWSEENNMGNYDFD